MFSLRRSLFLVFLSLFAFGGPGISHAQVINEFVVNHTGWPDSNEYMEVFGAASTDLSHLTLLQIEGDLADDPGEILRAIPVGTTNGDGLWWTGFLTEPTSNNDRNLTLFLVTGFSESVGADLDGNNDGELDSTPWSGIIDEVGVVGLDEAGHTYTVDASMVLIAGTDGQNYTWGGASRIPDGWDTGTPSDWVRNDYFGAGLPGFDGVVDANEAYNTPGTSNSTTNRPPAAINEFVADHVGTPDDHEYVEIFGEAVADYSDNCLLVVVGDFGSIGVVGSATQLTSTDSNGYWTTGFMNAEMEDGSFTLILADFPTCGSVVGTDLDSNDDGVFDAPTPWSDIHDSVAISDGDPSDVTYSTVVLGPAFDGIPGTPGGASRVPNGTNTNSTTDWMRNDFDGDGLDGFSGTPDTGEAVNTPGQINRAGVGDYYSAVDPSSSASLRATLHDTVDDHQKFEYTASATDTWDILELGDEDPNDSTKILDVYKNASYAKAGGGNDFYNREHSWPNAYGFPDDGASNSAYTDCHHLMLSNIGYNSDRGSKPFDDCPGCTEKPTVFNNGTGGPGMSNWTDATRWETWVGRQGDVARAQLYMDVRYEGGTHGGTGYAEPDLILTDTTALIEPTGGNASVAYMGLLSVLLQWHVLDPVDDLERFRNDVVYSYQGNRNPFVDHPEWAECVFLGTGCGALPMFEDGFESGDFAAWSGVVGD